MFDQEYENLYTNYVETKQIKKVYKTTHTHSTRIQTH